MNSILYQAILKLDVDTFHTYLQWLVLLSYYWAYLVGEIFLINQLKIRDVSIAFKDYKTCIHMDDWFLKLDRKLLCVTKHNVIKMSLCVDNSITIMFLLFIIIILCWLFRAKVKPNWNAFSPELKSLDWKSNNRFLSTILCWLFRMKVKST